jgi:hypothetical protein
MKSIKSQRQKQSYPDTSAASAVSIKKPHQNPVDNYGDNLVGKGLYKKSGGSSTIQKDWIQKKSRPGFRLGKAGITIFFRIYNFCTLFTILKKRRNSGRNSNPYRNYPARVSHPSKPRL